MNKLIILMIILFNTLSLLANDTISDISNKRLDDNEKLQTKKITSKNSDILDSSLFAAIVASLLTIILSESIKKIKNNKSKKNNYKILLINTQNEVAFYKDKLEQLSLESFKIYNDIINGKDPIIPTYDLYPDFLEQSKIKLNKLFMNSKIVKNIGECHYELSHIKERLNLMKSTLRKNYDPKIQVKNVQGFKKLVDKNITQFKQLLVLIKKEIENF